MVTREKQTDFSVQNFTINLLNYILLMLNFGFARPIAFTIFQEDFSFTANCLRCCLLFCRVGDSNRSFKNNSPTSKDFKK